MSLGHVIPFAAVLAATAALSACGGGGEPAGDGLPKVLAAVSQTLSQRAISNLTLDDAEALGGADTTVYGRGAFIFPTGLGFQAIAIPDPAGGDPIKAYLVFEPRRVYLQPIKGVVLPPGKLWLSAGAGKAPLPPRVARFVAQAESTNPQLYLNSILWGASTASAKGAKVVHHVPLERYEVTIDLKRALEGARSTFPAMAVALRAGLAALSADGSTTMPVTVLVDAAGRVAVIEAALPGSDVGDATMQLGAFGVELKTSLPPAAQTVDLATRPAGSSPWRPQA